MRSVLLALGPWLALPLFACNSGLKHTTKVVEETDAPLREMPASGPVAATPAVPAEQPVAAATLAEAKNFYAQRCALCHGSEGRGNGVAAQNLRPQPRSFWEPGWQAGAKDADIAMIIVRGGSSVGKSMMMPASTDLADKPQVVRALVAVVRSFQPAPAAAAGAAAPVQP